ncbi:MAG: c-type cytochrome [Nitrospirae bacterium]|nr:c-type cytochrome [Nitrospirota bacterium]
MREVRRKVFNKAVMVTLIIFIFTTMLIIINAATAMAVDGKKVFESRCVICHGVKGDGKGLMDVVHRNEKKGMVWKVYPRDFTTALFKFRSTPTGCLPTDDDILRVLTTGIPRSYMPSQKDLTLEERKAVVQYIKTFSPRWKEEQPCEPIKVVQPSWLGSPTSVAKGEEVWKAMKCVECHGNEGKGDGPKSNTLKDDWGDQVIPFDFTSGATKMGFDPKNIYKAFSTGLDGSGMPSYGDSLSEDERWNLVSYTLKLMGRLNK